MATTRIKRQETDDGAPRDGRSPDQPRRNRDTPHLAVFQLQAVKDNFSKNGVIIFGPDNQQIYLPMAEYAKLHTDLRKWLDLKQKELISYEKVQKVYLDKAHAKFTLCGDTREHQYQDPNQSNSWKRVTWKKLEY